MRSLTNSLRVAFLILAALPLMLVSSEAASAGTSLSSPLAKNDWKIGNIVVLCQGTQIRQGPGLGYCYHTIVPENDWAVKVINGPKLRDGRTWYDTSRKEAGDPSGGTGWVNIEQADTCPAANEGGIKCEDVPGTQATPTPSPTPPGKLKIEIPKALNDLLRWWLGEPIPVKIGVVVVAFILLPATRRLGALGSWIMVNLVRAILWGIILGGLADLTRTYWQSAWVGFAGGSSGFDLAVLLLIAPLLWWALGFVSRIATRAIGIVVLVILLLLLLAFVAPDRFNALLSTLQGGAGR